MRLVNLSAGPSALPLPVLQRLKDGVLEYDNSSVGIFELGHRTKLFEKLLEETKVKIKTLLKISDDFEVLFCTGGATQQFSMIPLNVGVPLNVSKSKDLPAGYIVSGHWARLATDEAIKFRKVEILATSEDANYSRLPHYSSDRDDLSYIHFTSNNTIFGTQFQKEPEVSSLVPLICDASSDIFSRPIDSAKYSLIYAGAQKNLGTAGVTIVITRKSILDDNSDLPVSMNYQTYIKSKSNFNTPPVSTIVSVYEILRWIEEEGGVAEMEKRSHLRSKEVYQALDEVDAFIPFAEKSSRSNMNITFTGQNKEIEAKFINFAYKSGFMGIEGHRMVGGLRASFYNAISLEDASSFAQCIRDFSKIV